MAPKKDVSRSIRLSAEDEAFFIRMAGRVDCSFSDLMRDAAKLGLPLILASPSLVGRIELDDMDKNLFPS